MFVLFGILNDENISHSAYSVPWAELPNILLRDNYQNLYI